MVRDWQGRLRKTAITLLVIFVALAIPWTYFNIMLGIALEREIEQIRERGQPVTIEQAAPPMPPADENAAPIYNKIFRLEEWAFTAEIENPEPDPTPSLLSQVPDEFSQARDHPDQFDHPDEILRRAMHDPTLERIFSLLVEASQRPKCVFNIPWEDGPQALLPQMSMFRECARWLEVRIRLSGEDGKVADAAHWLTVGLRTTGHIRQDPSIIGQLVSYAVEDILLKAAREGPLKRNVPRDTARDLMGNTDVDDVAPAFDKCLVFERAWSYGVFDWVEEFDDPPKTVAEILGSQVPVPEAYARIYLSPIGVPIRKYDRLRYLRASTQTIEALSVPYRSIPDEFRNRKHAPESHPLLVPIAGGLFPFYTGAAARRDASIARLDQFQIALMLNVHRQQHGGYPRTLDELAQAMDCQPPEDIFAGAPFHYRRDGGGYLLWSLGPDLKDDGGHGYQEEGYSWEHSDIVWRVEG